MISLKFTLPMALGALLVAAPASAQLKGNIAVGVSVAKVKTDASELASDVSVGPTVTRLPTEGWGFAFALNWFGADVDGSVTGVDGNLGRVATRPLMVGVGYTILKGKWAFAPSVVAGPSFNKMRIDDRWDDTFDVEDDSFFGNTTFAVRPGVNATYALTSRFGLTGFGGYFVNRPEFTINTPTGPVETKWKGDGFVLSSGVIVTF